MASGPLAAPRQKFSKNERLCAKTEITRLLNKGRYFSVDGIFRVCVLKREKIGGGREGLANEAAETPGARLLISVPKRHFKRAVKRNLLKRRIREAYRRNKPVGSVDLMLVYLCEEVLDYASIAAAIQKIKSCIEESL